jgi:hypothetical protein
MSTWREEWALPISITTDGVVSGKGAASLARDTMLAILVPLPIVW